MKKYIILLLLTVILNSCWLYFYEKNNEEEPNGPIYDENGVLLYKPYLWSLPVAKGYNYNEDCLEAPIFYMDNVLLDMAYNSENYYFRMVNVNDGEIIWEKPYYFKYNFKIREAYLYKNLAVIQEFCHPRYCMDMITGDMKWGFSSKEDSNDFYSNITGIDSIFFVCESPFYGTPTKGSIGRGFYGNVNDGIVYPFLTPDFRGDTSKTPFHYAIGGVYRILPFKNDTGAILLVVLYEKAYPDHNWRPLLGLYNFSERKWIYDNISLQEPSFFSRPMPNPVIYKNKIYGINGDRIWCADLYTGQIIWGKEYTCVFEHTNFLVSDNKVIAINCYDILVALDVKTGVEIWRNTECSSNTSNMIELNGILYFASNGNGRLHAVEISTGKLLWKIKMPDSKKGASLQPELTVVPGKDGKKGKIVVRTFLNAYCFEAER